MPESTVDLKRLESQRWTPWRYTAVSFYILSYYLISVTLSMFQTQVLGRTRMNFPYPLFAALVYDLCQFSLACSIMAGMAVVDPRAVGPVQAFRNLGSSKFWRVIFPCALAAGLDIALSNSSLKYVSLSFYTMVKSSSPMFILIFAFVFGLEKISLPLVGIIAVIGTGTLLTVYNPAAFDLFGFALVFSAAIMSGVRWALTQLIIEIQAKIDDDDDTRTADGPLSAILFLTPPIGFALGLLCQTFERFHTIAMSSLFESWEAVGRTAAICAAGGVLTFSLILAEYKVVENTSVVTLSISGIVKEIVMIAVSVLYFKDQLLPINYVGLAVSISGIVGYNVYKVRRKRSSKLRRANSHLYLAVPTNEPLQDDFINPFIDNAEAEADVYLELDSSAAKALSRHASFPGIPDSEEYYNSLKQQWSELPPIEHYPATSGPTHPRAPGRPGNS